MNPSIDDRIEHCVNELIGIIKHTESFNDDPEKKARQLERNKRAAEKAKETLHSILLKEGELGVKWAIAMFLRMNLENPKAPVNVDEVKRRAIKVMKERHEDKGTERIY